MNADVLRRRVIAHRMRDGGHTVREISRHINISERHVERYLSWPKPKALSSLRSNWFEDAACSGMDTEVFYPSSKGKGAEMQRKKALAVCLSCPVMDACRANAEANLEQWGVWGGRDFARYKYRLNEDTGEVDVLERSGPVKKVS